MSTTEVNEASCSTALQTVEPKDKANEWRVLLHMDGYGRCSEALWGSGLWHAAPSACSYGRRFLFSVLELYNTLNVSAQLAINKYILLSRASKVAAIATGCVLVLEEALDDLQTKLYTWRWPAGPKHAVNLNIWNRETRKHNQSCI
jgi:hypothetical protein